MPRWKAAPGTRVDDRHGVVSYKLARQQTVTAYEQGRKFRREVCDAQPELRRVAHHHAQDLNEDCPICAAEGLGLVTFAFGPGLPGAGRCVTDEVQMKRLAERGRTTTCYRVEVCRTCWWNHLRESFPLSSSDTYAAGR